MTDTSYLESNLPKENIEEYYIPVTIYLSVYNEEKTISKRLQNILSLDYPKELFEVIVVSDGSTDKTIEKAKEIQNLYPSYDIQLISFEDNQGPARTQNIVAEKARYDILLSTGAQTVFSRNLLKEIMKCFRNPKTGVVGGRVEYNSGNTPIGNSYRTYRNLERKIRILETELNICVKTDGACTAYRKSIWEKINSYEDVDQVIPLLSRKKGYLTIHNDKAIAYDMANLNRKQEILSRARMTRKALFSICTRWDFRDIFEYFPFSFALFSHKVLRFFSPAYSILFFITMLILAIQHNFIGKLVVLFLTMTILLIISRKYRMPLLLAITDRVISFCYANIGFLLGIIQWIAGKKEGRFDPTRTY